MTSMFSWLDFSEKDRRRALDAISLLNGPDTRDELGVGTIRDALADTLFPGTTTIQTRARYFLLIPWLYQMLEKRRAVRHGLCRGRVADDEPLKCKGKA